MGLSNYLSLPRSLQCNLDRIFNYKTIWPMAVFTTLDVAHLPFAYLFYNCDFNFLLVL